jgi:hypothetical protein
LAYLLRSLAEEALRKPIADIAGCCARAAIGQAAVDPAITLMKSRRRIACPKGQMQQLF